ncbi:MAG: GNAT family N-acetyltransferase [Chloroflexota bacterium]
MAELVEGRPEPVVTVEDDPSGADVAILGRGLTEHARPTTGVDGFRALAMFLRDADGKILGGVAASVNWDWLQINLVWLAEPLRGGGYGRRLMEAIEGAGRARGCTKAHLDTFSWQARPFYERLGYEVFAVLDDYPPGSQRFYMRKSLV